MTGIMFHNPDEGAELPKTISLTERDARTLARVLGALVGSDSARLSQIAEPDNVTEIPDRGKLVERARREFQNRRLRTQLFGSSMFGEPSWDMLLALYVNEPAGPRTTVGRVLAFSGAAQTTALRWLQYLEQNKLVEREPHPTDSRSSYIELTDTGRAALDLYFSETLKSGP